MRLIAICTLFGMTLGVDVVAGERQDLWPVDKMPHSQEGQIGATTEEAKQPGFDASQHRMPYIEWFDGPDSTNAVRGCVLIVSGGGYDFCHCGRVEEFRRRFTELGFQCVSLVYRTGRPMGLPYYQSGWEDGQRAVRLIRHAAVIRGFDPERIGAISISAGAHIATLLATSSRVRAYAPVDDIDGTSCHLNFVITCALAYALTSGPGITDSRDGDASDIGLDPIFQFDAKTPPMCMFHGGADVHSPFASTRLYRRLRELNVPAELHLFADRGHSFWGKNEGAENATGYDNWFGRAEEFLRQLGFLGPIAPEVEIMQRYADDGARGERFRALIWPDGKTPDMQTNQCSPYIEWHVPKKTKTKAIQIIYSGGGYKGNGTDGFEVAPARRYLNAKGMTVVTLRYRSPRPEGLPKHVTAWQDLQRAIRIVRSEASSRGLDPNRIGIMGSSAGGHLSLMGATSSRHHAYRRIDGIDDLSCAVQWAVAIYPAYALTDGSDCHNVTGGNDDSARLVPEFDFDLSTCPVVFVHGDSDGWAAMNSVKCWEQLRRMGVQCDLHTLAKRSHCFQQKSAPGTGSYTYLDRIWEFLCHKGFNQ